MEQRAIKRPGQPPKRFVVPILDIDVPLRELQARSTARATFIDAPDTTAELDAAPQSFRPVNVAALPPAPSVSVAEQVAAVGKPSGKPPRKNAAEQIRSTGLSPRREPIGVAGEDSDELAGDGGLPAPSAPVNEGVSAADADGPHAAHGAVADTPSPSPPVNRVAIAAREAGLDDVGRHDLAQWASVGRTRSSAALDEGERALAIDAARQIGAGSKRLQETEDGGGWKLVDTRFGWANEAGEHPVTESSDAVTVAAVLSADQIAAMRGPELQVELKARGLPLGGKVDELKARLMDACGVTGEEVF